MSSTQIPAHVLLIAQQLKSFISARNPQSSTLSEYARKFIDYLVPEASDVQYPSGWTNPRQFRAAVQRFESDVDLLDFDFDVFEREATDELSLPRSVTQRRRSSRKSFFKDPVESAHSGDPPDSIIPAVTSAESIPTPEGTGNMSSEPPRADPIDPPRFTKTEVQQMIRDA